MKSALLFTLVFCLLFLLYRLLLSRSGKFKTNRMILLSMPVLAFIAAYATIPLKVSERLQTQLPEVIIGSSTQDFYTSQSEGISTLSIIYWSITALFGLLLLVKIVRSFHIKPEGMCFSFFSHIYVSKELAENTQAVITDHELVHVRKKHSLDIIFAELIGVIAWFNPFIYWWKKEIKLNHEFEADAEASHKHPNYSTLLVSQALKVDQFTLVHSFNKSNLKTRLMMIENKNKSHKLRHYLLFASIGVSSIGLCMISPSMDMRSAIDQVETVGDNTDQAQFPGGQEALMKYMMNNVKYPKAAAKEGVEGKVMVKFIVGTDGQVKKVSVAKSAHELLDAEAVRVIEAMPKWQAAQKDGKSVESEMVMPVVFKLD